MAIKIVTDSSADMPEELVKELGIEVVPLYVRFGEDVLRINVDISHDDFYRRLRTDEAHPTTIQPSPQDFSVMYDKLAKEADGIVSIHISSKLSGTYNSAVQAKAAASEECPIEVIDSAWTSVGLGMICCAAGAVAKAGGSMQEVIDEAKKAVDEINLLCLMDTLKYLLLGGRIGKAKALLGSILNVKPIVTLRDGEVVPAGQARSRTKGVEKLFDLGMSGVNIKDLYIGYNTTPDEAEKLAERVSSVFPKEQIKLAKIGPVLGVHAGPGTIILTFRGDTKQ